jgi:dTMP kinase
MRSGLFIVLEGVDGAGTTTQAARLAQTLRARRCVVHETREPSTGPVGALLRLALSGRLVTPGQLGSRAPGWRTMALMFAADRLDHIEAEITPLLDDGMCVISDRYYHSSVAYQSLSANDSAAAIAWIRSINQHARTPDLTIVLDVSAPVAAQRRRSRGGVELYDDDTLQASLVDFYDTLEAHFPGERIVHVPAEGSIEQIAEAVFAHVEPRLT